MASSAETSSTQQFVDCDEYIDLQLQRTRANIKITDILTAAGGAIVLLLSYVLGFVVLDHWVIAGGFGYTARVLMLGALLLAVAAWVGWKVVRPYMKSVNRLFAARVIEQSEPKLHSMLLSLVDLRRAERDVSPQILASMEKRAAVRLSHMDVDHAVDRRQLMRVSYALLVVVVLFCLYTLFSPKKISASVWRALFPIADVSVATRTEIIDVKPGHVEVLARSQLEVTADLRGETPERVTLLYTTADRRYVDEPVEMRLVEESVQQYQGLIAGEKGRGILQDMTYHVIAGDDRSEDFRITVIQPPSAKVDEVRYVYPAYMELEPRTQPGGHIDAWEGTGVTISATANMPLKEASMLFSDDEDTSVVTNKTELRRVGENRWKNPTTHPITENEPEGQILRIGENGTYPRYYHIYCKNNDGQTDPDPALYSIKIRPDQAPEVALLDPTHDLQRPANAIVPLVIQARDPDFKLRYVTLKLEKDGEELPGVYLLDGTTTGLKQSFSTAYDFELKPLNLKTGDEITFWIEARDNKTPQANKKNTPSLKIRIIDPVSEKEVQEQLKQDKHEQRQKLEEMKQDGNEAGVPEPQPQEDTGEEKRDEATQPDDKQDPAADKPKSPQESPAEGKAEEKSPDGASEAGSKAGDQGQQSPEAADDEEALREFIKRHKEDVEQGLGKEERKNGRKEDGKSPDKGPPETAPSEEPSDPNSADTEKKRPGGPDGTKKDDPAGEKEPNGSDSGMKKEEPGDGASKKGDAKGEPTRPDANPAENQPGKTKDSSETKPGSKNPGQPKEPLNGKTEPAGASDEARKKEATGKETGEATTAKDQNVDAKKAENELKRKDEGDTSPRKKSSDPGNPDAGPRKSGDPGAEGERKKKMGSRLKQEPDDHAPKSPNDTQPPPSSKQKTPPGSAKTDTKQKDNVPCPHCNDKGCPKCSGSKGSDSAGEKTGSEGDSGGEKSDENNPSGKKGDGQSGRQKAAEKSADPKGGESGSESAKKEAAKAPGKKGSEESDGGSQGKEPGEGSGASKEGPPRKTPGKGGSQSPTGMGGREPGGARGGQKGDDAGAGDGPADGAEDADEANLEYSKKAANLVLKRLEDELKRGDIDRELLDRLGWDEERMRRFADRLRRQLDDPGDDQSPGAVARRRQFEEMLKSLDLRSTETRRDAKSTRQETGGGIDARDLPVPPEYREAYDAFTKSLSKRNRGKTD